MQEHQSNMPTRRIISTEGNALAAFENLSKLSYLRCVIGKAKQNELTKGLK